MKKSDFTIQLDGFGGGTLFHNNLQAEDQVRVVIETIGSSYIPPYGMDSLVYQLKQAGYTVRKHRNAPKRTSKDDESLLARLGASTD